MLLCLHAWHLSRCELNTLSATVGLLCLIGILLLGLCLSHNYTTTQHFVPRFKLLAQQVQRCGPPCCFSCTFEAQPLHYHKLWFITTCTSTTVHTLSPCYRAHVCLIKVYNVMHVCTIPSNFAQVQRIRYVPLCHCALSGSCLACVCLVDTAKAELCLHNTFSANL